MRDLGASAAVTAKEPLPSERTPPPAKRGKRRSLLMICAVCLLALLFYRALSSLYVRALTSEFDSYILLVPFIFVYLLFSRNKVLPLEHVSSLGPAILLFFLGLAAIAVAVVEPWGAAIGQDSWLSLLTLSFVCLTAGAGFLLLGKSWMRGAAFPFFFLIFLVPLPSAFVGILETLSQHASAWAADVFFQLGGTPYIHDGMIFQLPNINIRVAQECSGIRSSWILLITSILAANTFLRPNWKRAVLVLAVIPLGIIRNGFRVWVIGLLCVHFGPQMINNPVHRRGGPLFFALSLIPLFCLIAWLRRGERAPGKLTQERPLAAA